MEILIVEDCASIRIQLVQLLEGQYGYNVVAAVESAEEALNYLSFNPVGLIILDLGLPGLSDSKAVLALKTVCPEVKIMVLSASDDDQKVFSALRAGAIGYLLKSAQPGQIIAALEEIRAGGSPTPPSIARKVLQDYQRQPERDQASSAGSILSSREAEILTLLYRGDELAEIAERLCISLHTVRVHAKKIYTKLRVNSRSHAIYQALKMKLIEP
jgi:DNA-binding NarL/FixJ family response regulator